MLPAALAICSSLVWGVSDFAGGVLVRRHPVATIALLGHATSLVALGIVAAVVGVDRTALLFGLAAGSFGGVTLFAFFKAMSLGTMSIVSPLLSLGSLLAFVLAVIGGERPSQLSVLGALIALVGAALAASARNHSSGRTHGSALRWALMAPLTLGFYLYLLGRGADEGASVSAVFGARTTSSFVLLGLALWLHATFRIGWSAFSVAVLIGLTASAALLAFGYAVDLGFISISSILASLYPAVTIVLAHLFLGERLRNVQLAGVLLILLGVVLVTVGR